MGRATGFVHSKGEQDGVGGLLYLFLCNHTADEGRAVVVDPNVYGSLHLALAVASLENLLVATQGTVQLYKLEVKIVLFSDPSTYYDQVG